MKKTGSREEPVFLYKYDNVKGLLKNVSNLFRLF